jgi:hypothetical protein
MFIEHQGISARREKDAPQEELRHGVKKGSNSAKPSQSSGCR